MNSSYHYWFQQLVSAAHLKLRWLKFTKISNEKVITCTRLLAAASLFKNSLVTINIHRTHIKAGRVFWGVFMYRWERGWYLLFGRGYEIFRVILTPLYNLAYAYSNIEIHYKADVKGGIMILHPSVGVVVSGLSVVGKNLTLTGGNVIGAKPGTKRGEIIIGDNCSLGANVVIIDPVKLGNKINIGASACVVKDCLINSVSLMGVPAKVYAKEM